MQCWLESIIWQYFYTLHFPFDATRAIHPKELERMIVDTSVQEKAIAYPEALFYPLLVLRQYFVFFSWTINEFRRGD